ncbi:MAG: MATE family efflux transporter [Phycisphaerae bacterium]|nr:MATE family efflux transporter [Phycisphaerae bacterium]
MSPTREVWSLAWPTVLTMASYTTMQFVDSLMVARVGSLEVAAQGNGGVWSFTLMSFLFGIVTMVNSYVSQALGAGRPHEVARYGWAGLWFSLVAWAFLLVPFAFVIPSVFSWMGHEPRLVELESEYAQILLVGGLVTLTGKSLSQFFFGIQRPKLITVAAVVGNVVNILGNYVFIYGERGLPEWGLSGIAGMPAFGVGGAAIGTILGTACECLIPLCVFLGPKMEALYGVRSSWRPEFAAVRDLLRVGWPNALALCNEIVCWAIFMSWLVGLFGTVHLTAGWIALRYMHLSFMPAVGFSVAATSLVGKYIGAGKPDVAAQRAQLTLVMALIYMTVCGVIMGVFRHGLITFFVSGSNADPAHMEEIVRIGGWMMICAAVFQTFDAVGIVFSGALRGAGDTIFPGIITVVFSWVFIVGLGWLLAVHWAPSWESFGPWVASSVYIILLGLAVGGRFYSGAWKRRRLVPAAE